MTDHPTDQPDRVLAIRMHALEMATTLVVDGPSAPYATYTPGRGAPPRPPAIASDGDQVSAVIAVAEQFAEWLERGSRPPVAPVAAISLVPPNHD